MNIASILLAKMWHIQVPTVILQINTVAFRVRRILTLDTVTHHKPINHCKMKSREMGNYITRGIYWPFQPSP